jgi:hypothetical protein
MSGFDAVDGSPPTASQCADPDSDVFTACYILAFAERLLLASSCPKRQPQITSG